MEISRRLIVPAAVPPISRSKMALSSLLCSDLGLELRRQPTVHGLTRDVHIEDSERQAHVIATRGVGLRVDDSQFGHLEKVRAQT